MRPSASSLCMGACLTYFSISRDRDDPRSSGSRRREHSRLATVSRIWSMQGARESDSGKRHPHTDAPPKGRDFENFRRIRQAPPGREFSVGRADLQDQLSISHQAIDRGKGDPVEGAGLGQGVGAGVAENHPVADPQAVGEPVGAEKIAGKAGAASQQVFVGRVVIVPHEVRLEAVLEHLRHVIDRGIQHRHRGPAAGKQVQHGRDEVAGGADQPRTRFDEHLRPVLGVQGVHLATQLGETIAGLAVLLEQVAAAQVQPLHPLQQAGDMLPQQLRRWPPVPRSPPNRSWNGTGVREPPPAARDRPAIRLPGPPAERPVSTADGRGHTGSLRRKRAAGSPSVRSWPAPAASGSAAPTGSAN